MFKLLVIGSLLALALSKPMGFNDPDFPIINTTGGEVQGERLECGIFCNYYSFKGIPYAAPPVGDLRFRNPQPHAGWQGVRPANQHGNVCVQPGGDGIIGSEDCLFLNIYNQDLIGAKPVMVFIHGGSYIDGSGNSDEFGPEYFVQEGVVIVTINYRLNIFGFLSTGDRHAQGNYGQKDMVEALRWIRDNIANFGGDPNNVTIFGESAGSSAVHFLVLSPMATGLFHKAILQSGVVICPWAFQPDPLTMAYELGANFGLGAVSTEALVSELRMLPFIQLIFFLQQPRQPTGMRPFDFVPSVEGADFDEPRFLTEDPFQMLIDGNFNHVPLIIGFNDAEALYEIRSPLPDASDPDNLVPIIWNVPSRSAAAVEIANTFSNFYWNNGPMEDNRFEVMEYATDHIFVYGIDKSVALHVAAQTEPVFYYKFSFDGDLNGMKIFSNTQMYPGATHADDLFYMFVNDHPAIPVVPTSNPAYTVRLRMVRMWSNFAKYSNPTVTLDDLINVEWSPVSETTTNYLEINAQLTAGVSPTPARLNLWKDLEARFANFLA